MSDDAKLTGLRARLEAAKAAKAAIDAARAVPTEADLLAEVDAAERDAADAQALQEAECKHGRADVKAAKIATVATDLGLVIVKRAHPATFKKFQDDGVFNTKAAAELVRGCLIHPELGRFESMCDDQPAILSRVVDAVATLAGMRKAEIAGKSGS